MTTTKTREQGSRSRFRLSKYDIGGHGSSIGIHNAHGT